jgi:hypothetical protein
MSANPEAGVSPGFCHIRRQSNRSAQKQIICPIYRGIGHRLPYRKGLGTKFLRQIGPDSTPQIAKPYSFFTQVMNDGSLQGISGMA